MYTPELITMSCVTLDFAVCAAVALCDRVRPLKSVGVAMITTGVALPFLLRMFCDLRYFDYPKGWAIGLGMVIAGAVFYQMQQLGLAKTQAEIRGIVMVSLLVPVGILVAISV